MKLIDKDALVADIENLNSTYKKCPTRNSYEEGLKDGRLIGYKDALHKIDILEVKEVDLKKEYKEFIQCTDGRSMFETAKHFFELGLSVSSTKVTTPDIDDVLKENGVNPYSKEAKVFKESYYTALEKLKAQKGE